jgi:hypothetical protein
MVANEMWLGFVNLDNTWIFSALLQGVLPTLNKVYRKRLDKIHGNPLSRLFFCISF